MNRYRVKREWITSSDPSRKFGGPLNAGEYQLSVQVRKWIFFWKTIVSSPDKKPLIILLMSYKKALLIEQGFYFRR